MNFLLDDLINLPKVRIRNVIKESTETFLILDCLEEEVTCPHCENKTDKIHQTRTKIVRDLPISGQIIYLNIPKRQFHCEQCQKHFTEELEFVERGRRFTQRYEKYVYERVIASSVEQVRREEDLSWDQVNRIHQHQYEIKKKVGRR
ncbi:transposase family protein [Spirulina major CS-329]|jgi:transposase|uniref:helix-turn-helix domain-containing protein n=1 Tax=Spirulina TaxID=1154 RepID=UPI00232CEB5F|nr:MULTISPECIES: transposase family protein [Spirulina]MDB9496368.1 transposase family protein [Spirulina subsalsa CS-330]MDB9501440.1 transposase family protein [Spirulina major CS-329]